MIGDRGKGLELTRRNVLCGFLLFCDVFMADILPLFAFVPRVVELGDADIESNAKSKGTCKDGANENAVALEEGVVDGSGQRHD